jgi:uncharacterized membrane protein
VNAHLLKYWIAIRESYWFWPTVMAISAILLAFLTTEVDTRVSRDWLRKVPFFYATHPEGARAVLATVAGSMITVTGITFSLTLLAVSHGTSQFGPRLLTNFMRDRGNQVTLGTFIATFLYCLMVLRTVRSAAESSGLEVSQPELVPAFVPHLSLMVALILTIASVGVLIYFIHHIPESIRLSNVVADIGRQLMHSIDELFPESLMEDSAERPVSGDPRSMLPDNLSSLSAVVVSKGDGYLQVIDGSGLMQRAVGHDLVLEICARPGQFISRGQPLLRVFPEERCNERLERNLEYMFVRGAYRTSTQNALFLVDQLVEVAARALSPGVNDPMSAITCIDWLQSALIRVAQRRSPESCRFDNQGIIRIFSPALCFQDFCTAVFDQLRPYVATDRNAALHMMNMMRQVAASTSNASVKAILDGHARELIRAADSAQLFEGDMAQLRERYSMYPTLSTTRLDSV